jgi:glycosyltransferase involved in cell wall biosynthesis
MSSQKILIIIGGHLATAPRPQKEAAVARDAGFQVLIRGTLWDDRLAREDLELAQDLGIDYAPVVDLRPSSKGASLHRLRLRASRELFTRLGIITPRVYGAGASELLTEALKINADLTMVHSEVGLWVGEQLMKRGFRVGCDFEDWFSEDLPESDRKGRPIQALKRLERLMVRKADPVLATTRAMAEALAHDAGSDRIPTVIPNCFPYDKAPKEGVGPRDQRDPEAVSFYWFSQTIGPGRGLETLAKALPLLTGNWQLFLRGEIRQYHPWFEATFPETIRSRVHLLPSVPNADLANYTSSHDVGLALEVPHCVNRNMTATNKIFEYLRCGLAVVATSTKGQVEVMNRCPDAGWVIPPSDASSLAKVLQGAIEDRETMSHRKIAAKKAAHDIWSLEQYSEVMYGAFQSIICRNSL